MRTILLSEDIFGDASRIIVKMQSLKRQKRWGRFDLVIYSLMSPRGLTSDGKVYRACPKPVGMIYKNKTSIRPKEVKEITIDPASDDEIYQTEKVKGGEDWELWTRRLLDDGLLADGCVNLAYSYVDLK